MNDAQTVSLAEPVKSQRIGILLHWQGYLSGGGTQNYDHCFQLVPRQHVIEHPGAGIACTLSTQTKMSRKYVYVSNDRITGHEKNDQVVPMTDGGNFYNNAFVLTEVIGI